jgi:hypothetical protein
MNDARRAELEAVAKQLAGNHYDCEDCWYSCPLSADGCCNENQEKVCTCGVESRRTQILEALQQVEREVWTKAAEGYARYINGEFDEPRFEDWCIQQREGR